jgi:hypothetical protein
MIYTNNARRTALFAHIRRNLAVKRRGRLKERTMMTRDGTRVKDGQGQGRKEGTAVVERCKGRIAELVTGDLVNRTEESYSLWDC